MKTEVILVKVCIKNTVDLWRKILLYCADKIWSTLFWFCRRKPNLNFDEKKFEISFIIRGNIGIFVKIHFQKLAKNDKKQGNNKWNFKIFSPKFKLGFLQQNQQSESHSFANVYIAK